MIWCLIIACQEKDVIYLLCNYNDNFYIKYSNLLSFELLKCSKSLSGWGLCPQNTCYMVILYCVWKPPSKNPGTIVGNFQHTHYSVMHGLQDNVDTEIRVVHIMQGIKVCSQKIERFYIKFSLSDPFKQELIL